MRRFALVVVLFFFAPAGARADASITTLERGAWPDAVNALQSDTGSEGSVLSICVRDGSAIDCAACGNYTLSFDEAGRAAFAIGACDAASGTTRITLLDRDALFEAGRVVPRPRAITIHAWFLRSVASSGGGAARGCTARLHPSLRDLQHGTSVGLGPDRFRIVVRQIGVDVTPIDDGWMITSESSDVDYDVVEIASGVTVMSEHTSLVCTRETPDARGPAMSVWP